MDQTKHPLTDALSQAQSLGDIVNLETGWLVRWGLDGWDATRVLGTAVSPRVRLERVRDALARIAAGGRPSGGQGDEETPFLQRVSALGALIGLADERALGAHALPACRRAIGGRSGYMIHGVAGAALGESLRAVDQAMFGAPFSGDSPT